MTIKLKRPPRPFCLSMDGQLIDTKLSHTELSNLCLWTLQSSVPTTNETFKVVQRPIQLHVQTPAIMSSGCTAICRPEQRALSLILPPVTQGEQPSWIRHCRRSGCGRAVGRCDRQADRHPGGGPGDADSFVARVMGSVAVWGTATGPIRPGVITRLATEQ